MDINFQVGDIVKVYQKTKEGKRERLSAFRGKVIRIKGSGENKMFTVRANLAGVDVDRIYPLKSPVIEKIEVVSKPKKRPRRANLIQVKEKTSE
jgi:large subunit ribosomal protein L19